MKQHIITKSIAGLIAVAGILSGAPKAQATLIATLNVTGGASSGGAQALFVPVAAGPTASATYAFSTPTGFFGTGVQLIGGAANSQTTGGGTLGQLFDANTTINNTGATAVTLTFHFQQTAMNLGPLSGNVTAQSNLSGTNNNAPAVSISGFSSTVNLASTVTNVGAGFSTGGLLGPLAIVGSVNNSSTGTVFVPGGNFDIAQDFTFQVAAGATFNFSNSLNVPQPVAQPVPEPGSLITGASLLGLIGSSQLLRRKRNREVVG